MNQVRPGYLYAFNPLYVANFRLALSLLSTPMIYRACDAIPGHNFAWRALWRLVHRRANVFIACSRFVESCLIKSGVEMSKINVVYSHPPRRQIGSKTDMVERSSEPGETIVYVGQIIKEKGVDLLVTGESREWETVEYAHDAFLMGNKKAVIILGHNKGEEPGMEYFAEWLKPKVGGISVLHIPSGEPYWVV